MSTRHPADTSTVLLRISTLLLAASLTFGCSADTKAAEETIPAGDAKAVPSQLPSGHPPVEPPTVDPQAGGGLAPPPPGSGTGEAGLSWQTPSGWISRPPSNAMRKAQYQVPGSGGDGECVVFYFGPGQGGDPRSNAERWASQFAQPDGSSSLQALSTRQVDISGIPVLLVEVTGTYSGGMMGGGPSLKLTDYMLLGAVVQGRDANWFFKFTGPEATVREQEEPFIEMIRSLSPGG